MPSLPDDATVLAGAQLVHGLGIGRAAVLDALAARADPFREAGGLVAGFRPGTVAAPCPLPDARQHLATPKLRKLMSDDALLATVAARLACAESGLARAADRTVPDERLGAYVACGIGAAGWRELVPVFRDSVGDDGRLSLARLGERGLRRCNPLFAFQVLQNMALCFISIEESIRGENLALAPWDAGGAATLGEALAALQVRRVDAAVACGTSAMAGIQGTFWLARNGLLPPPGVRPRPLDSASAGLAPADGAAAVTLERLDAARARGIRPLAALTGFAQESDAAGEFAAPPDPAAVRRVVLRALDRAHRAPGDVAGAVLSAAGLPDADRAEAQGLAGLFDRPIQLAVPAAALGALFAAAPLAAVTLAAHALWAGTPLPATLAPEAVPPGCPLPVRAPGPLDGAVLITACGPGGGVSALVLEAVP